MFKVKRMQAINIPTIFFKKHHLIFKALTRWNSDFPSKSIIVSILFVESPKTNSFYFK